MAQAPGFQLHGLAAEDDQLAVEHDAVWQLPRGGGDDVGNRSLMSRRLRVHKRAWSWCSARAWQQGPGRWSGLGCWPESGGTRQQYRREGRGQLESGASAVYTEVIVEYYTRRDEGPYEVGRKFPVGSRITYAKGDRVIVAYDVRTPAGPVWTAGSATGRPSSHKGRHEPSHTD